MLKLAKKFGYLPYMVERYFHFLGEQQAKELLIANEKPLTPTIRVNTLKIDKDLLRVRLKNKGYDLESIENVPYGYKVLNIASNLGSSHEYLQGYYYIQNYASMLPAIVLNPNPGDTVIDMCAAPGSKATQLAQIMGNEGILHLIDRNQNRIPALRTNIDRMGVLNSIILNYDSKNLSKLNIKADKILLDAPCTGEGLINQDPSRKKSKSLSDISKMSKIQVELLKSGLSSLKSGGTLVYSTCSIGPEENEVVVDKALKDKENFEILKMPYQFGVNGLLEYNGKTFTRNIVNAQRLYPHLHETIGFFMCLIVKK